MKWKRQIAAAAAGILLGYGIWAAVDGRIDGGSAGGGEIAGVENGGGGNAGGTENADGGGAADGGKAGGGGSVADGSLGQGKDSVNPGSRENTKRGDGAEQSVGGAEAGGPARTGDGANAGSTGSGTGAGSLGNGGLDGVAGFGRAPGLGDAGGLPGLGGGTDLGGLSGFKSIPLVPALTDEETAAMKRLETAVKGGKKEKIAEVLLKDADTFSALFYETLEGKRWRFDAGALQPELAGKGLVLTGASSVFYGSFGADGPEGRCTVIQAVRLDEPRYDFSEGTWKGGRMSGNGTTGYRYYSRTPAGEAAQVLKKGRFADDLMEGTITVENTGSDGAAATWTMTVKKGVIQPDERWIRSAQDGIYRLTADDNPSYAYDVSEEEMGQTRWLNLLIWDVEN